jgi:hypothetical protein
VKVLDAALIGQINVEIDGLTSVAAATRDELEPGYWTQIGPVHEAIPSGASIGGPIAGSSRAGPSCRTPMA